MIDEIKGIALLERVINVRIYGVPESFPKKDIAIVNGKRRLIDKDYRTRKDPVTKKVTKYDRGYKARWARLVRSTVMLKMKVHGIEPFPKNHPIGLGCVFWLPKADSCKLEYPSQDPDLDNFSYSVWNALKRTPSKKVRGRVVQGDHPKGILYWDDNQIVLRLPELKLWADEFNQPGVFISCVDLAEVPSGILNSMLKGMFESFENDWKETLNGE